MSEETKVADAAPAKNPPSAETIIKRVIGVGRMMGLNLNPAMVQLANDDKTIITVRKITNLCINENPTLEDIDAFIASLSDEEKAQSEEQLKEDEGVKTFDKS